MEPDYYVITVYCTNCGESIDHFNLHTGYKLDQVHAVTHIPKGIKARDYIDPKLCPYCQCKYVLKPYLT
jgi:hypothetical protein